MISLPKDPQRYKTEPSGLIVETPSYDLDVDEATRLRDLRETLESQLAEMDVDPAKYDEALYTAVKGTWRDVNAKIERDLTPPEYRPWVIVYDMLTRDVQAMTVEGQAYEERVRDEIGQGVLYVSSWIGQYLNEIAVAEGAQHVMDMVDRIVRDQGQTTQALVEIYAYIVQYRDRLIDVVITEAGRSDLGPGDDSWDVARSRQVARSQFIQNTADMVKEGIRTIHQYALYDETYRTQGILALTAAEVLTSGFETPGPFDN